VFAAGPRGFREQGTGTLKEQPSLRALGKNLPSPGLEFRVERDPFSHSLSIDEQIFNVTYNRLVAKRFHCKIHSPSVVENDYPDIGLSCWANLL